MPTISNNNLEVSNELNLGLMRQIDQFKHFCDHIDSLPPKEKICKFGTPLMVNKVFLCELILKFFIRENETSLHIHKLKRIFDMLPDKIRDALSESYNNSEGYNSLLCNDLVIINDYFIKMRYRYETDNSCGEIGIVNKVTSVLTDYYDQNILLLKETGYLLVKDN